jgi:hypothetical protein
MATVEGLDAVLAKLKKGNILEALVQPMDTVGKAVVQTSKGYCTPGNQHFYRPPYQTGTLRRSITSIAGIEGDAVYATIGCGVEYGITVHEGSSRMGPRPFLTDAVEERKAELPKILTAELMKMFQ